MPPAASGSAGGPDRTPRASRRAAPYSRAREQRSARKETADHHRGKSLSRTLGGYLYNLVARPFKWSSHHDNPAQDGERDEQMEDAGQDEAHPIQLSDDEPRHDQQTPAARNAGPLDFPPTPLTSRRRLGESQSMPEHLSAARYKGSSPNERLARFFAEKGDRPLSDVEAEGVLALMQEGRTKGLDDAPSAFTPAFAAFDQPYMTQPTSLRHSVPSTSEVPRPSSSNTVSSSGSSVPRRAIYLGPGRSSSEARRRRMLGTGRAAAVARSQSDPYYNLAAQLARESESEEAGNAKRRRLGGAGDAELFAVNAPPQTELSDTVGLGTLPRPDSSRSVASAATPPRPLAGPSVAWKQRIGASATPVRPSPLRNVTQAATPSPLKADTAAKPSPAASVMLSILREDADKPKLSASASAPELDAIVSPYRTRSRAAQVEARRTATAEARKAKLAEVRKGKGKGRGGPEEGIQTEKASSGRRMLTTEELLERSMPLEYRPLDADGRPVRMHWGSSKDAPAVPPAAAGASRGKTLLERISGPLPTAASSPETEVDELEDEEEATEPAAAKTVSFGTKTTIPSTSLGDLAASPQTVPIFGTAVRGTTSTADMLRPIFPSGATSSAADVDDPFGFSPAAVRKKAKEAPIIANPFAAPPSGGDEDHPMATFFASDAFISASAKGKTTSTAPEDTDAKATASGIKAWMLPKFELLLHPLGGAARGTGAEERHDGASAAIRDVVLGMSEAELPSFNLA